KSPPKKKKPISSKSSALDSADLFEATVAGANREVSRLFSKYAEVLSERATADVSQVNELEGILMEARSLECHLKEKKDHLRRTLALISDQLQG
uniref:Si:dkey-40g16.5 n=1 Tax=Myripristis murdjan TaxID=586833 RepID=A0A667YJK5_9TELE